jgi:hypothetical protein
MLVVAGSRLAGPNPWQALPFEAFPPGGLGGEHLPIGLGGPVSAVTSVLGCHP